MLFLACNARDAGRGRRRAPFASVIVGNTDVTLLVSVSEYSGRARTPAFTLAYSGFARAMR
ncbi:hypothetical protein BURKHO8Y_240128 [Burkholderia sp. 8Y]|nr:hypothetical protein BURKHO8Y_240128 [Burkholderia sp. 8Y]